MSSVDACYNESGLSFSESAQSRVLSRIVWHLDALFKADCEKAGGVVSFVMKLEMRLKLLPQLGEICRSQPYQM